MITEANKKHSKLGSLFFWIGVVFCFIIFPVLLLDIGLESYIKTKNEVEELETYRKLGLELEKILQYGEAQHFYHSLLKKLFDIADKQNNPIDYLSQAIPHIKNRNPDTFNFIVWDRKTGKLVDSLTDEKEHRYVLKTINEVIIGVAEENDKNYPVAPKKLSIVEKKFNIIRSYIGNFLIPDNLTKPLLKGNLGMVIPSTANKKRSHFWFQTGKNITMVVTISKQALESNDYVNKLIKSMNKYSKDKIKFGMFDTLNDKLIIEEEKDTRIAELNLAFAKYENYSNTKLYTNNYLVLIKILNPFCRVFAYIPKNLVYKNENLKKNTLIISLLVEILFLLGLWLVYKFTTCNFSMSWKLAFLFLYANGLPLVALVFIGYDYLQQYRNIQLLQTYDNISQFLSDFDSKFGLIKHELSTKFNNIVDNINSNFSYKNVNKTYYKELEKEVLKTDSASLNIIDRKGDIIYVGSNKYDNSYLRNFGKSLVGFFNNATYTPILSFTSERNRSVGENSSLNSFYDDGIILDTIVSKKGRITLEHFIDKSEYYYFNFFGDSANRNFNSILIVNWYIEQLQENYVKNYIRKLNENNRKIKCVAYSELYGKIFPEEERNNSDLFNRFNQILNLKSVSFDKIRYNNIDYAAFGYVGRDLDQIALIGLFPLDIINERINKSWLELIGFIIINLMLTLGVSWVLSNYFLAPINDLREGIEAMGRQEFAYRLPIKSSDEFGSLNQVFNNTLESLEELSVATTVQENLFPLEPLKQNNAFIWGKSVTMTRLGGDYFDFFPLNDNEVGVLMGDVAGHGVPAGFLMAMAKASVLLSEEDKNTPSKLLSAVHKVFYHVKSKKIKRMMTCIYFCINTKTGEYRMANAGHCYPAFISKDGKVKFLEIDGTPLGITKRTRYVDTAGKLENNSYMLLYTDGMLEAHNKDGESIGIQRFTELISKSYSEDSETFYNNIFTGYKEWSPLADDDITMVLVKFGTESVEQVNDYSEKIEVQNE